MSNHLSDTDLAAMLERCEKALNDVYKPRELMRALVETDLPAVIRELQIARGLLREMIDDILDDEWPEDWKAKTRDFLEGRRVE